MQKKITILSLLLALLSSPLYAQGEELTPEIEPEEELPDASIDVDLAFVSNYVFRGGDLFQNRATQKGESYGAHTGETAFQPSITFNTPIGLYFNFWGSFATAGRENQDVDGRLQQQPGGSAITTNAAIAAVTTDAATTLALANVTDDEGTTDGIPGYYKELNGLKSLDELDLTIGYAMDTKVGSMEFGLVSYTNPNSDTKGAYGDPVEEIFFAYALPFLPDLSFSVWTQLNDSVNYYNLTYGSSFDIIDGISLDYSAGAGYGVQSKLQGVQDVTGSIGVTVYGFSVAYNVAYRPTLAFFDEDRGTNSFEGAFWPFGLSSAGDGLVSDPGQSTALVDRAINDTITSAVRTATGSTTYTYTPRQKLPKTLWWVSVGYSFSI